jgi:quinol monooxygenase YgiN
MPSVLIIHEVADYAAWKQAFDQAAGLRRDAGEISYDLLRFDDQSNKVVHFSEWISLDAARAFFESARVAEIRRKAGVKAPEFCYLERLEAGVL